MFGFYADYNKLSAITPVIIVTGIMGLIIGIVMLVLFLPAKNRGKYYGATKWLYDFLNFNKYLISGLVKILNITVGTICFLGGFVCLFISPLTGVELIIGGVVYRILMEIIMITLNIRDNISRISDVVSRNPAAFNSTVQPAPVQYNPVSTPAQPAPVQYNPVNPTAQPVPVQYNSSEMDYQPQPNTANNCQVCGAAIEQDASFCIKCGTKIV